MNNIYNQILWEKHFWLVLQDYIYNYPKIPLKSNKKNIYNVFINSGFLISHSSFKKHYFEYLENISIINYLDKREHLMNYVYNLYVYIFNKTKEYINELKKIKNNMEDSINDIDMYDKEPLTYTEFWNNYLKLYNPPPKPITYYNLIYIQHIMYLIILCFLLIFIFYIYKYEIRKFTTSFFRTISI